MATLLPPAGQIVIKGPASPDAGPHLSPAEAPLTFVGLIAVALISGSTVLMSAGTLTYAGLIPDPVIVTKTIEVPSGSIVYKGPARPQEVPQPGLGSLVFTGLTPQCTVGSGGTSPQINVGVGVLTWHGLVPTAFPDRSILMGAGTLTLAGQYVAVAFKQPDAGSLVWHGLLPTVMATSQLTVTLGVGAELWSGLVPISHLDQGPAMPAGSVVWHGLTVESDQTSTVTPSAGSLVFSGQVPLSLRDLPATPGVGRLVYAAQEVTVVLTTIYFPGAGSLAFTGYIAQPTVTANTDQTASPGAGSLVLAGQAPTAAATTTTTLTPGAGSIVLAGQAPIYFINNAPQMPAGSLVFSGPVFERSQIQEMPAGRIVWQGWLVRSVNSGDASPIPPLAYGSGLFWYQTQR